MLPKSIDELSEKLRLFPGVGKRSSQKLSLDVLNLSDEEFSELVEALHNVKDNIKFCEECGFFSENGSCEICNSKNRNRRQICLVEKPTDVISVEKSENYGGVYHVLSNLISPLDNIFAENTRISVLIERIENLLEEDETKEVELILFFKAGFASEATTAYIKELIKQKDWEEKIRLTRLAQGLPLYYNPDTLDQATMIKALEDRRKVA